MMTSTNIYKSDALWRKLPGRANAASQHGQPDSHHCIVTQNAACCMQSMQTSLQALTSPNQLPPQGKTTSQENILTNWNHWQRDSNQWYDRHIGSPALHGEFNLWSIQINRLEPCACTRRRTCSKPYERVEKYKHGQAGLSVCARPRRLFLQIPCIYQVDSPRLCLVVSMALGRARQFDGRCAINRTSINSYLALLL